MGEFDWKIVYSPDLPVLESVLRGSVAYLVVFALLRILLRRNVGELSITDLLMMVFVGNAATNALTGGYDSVASGLIVCATIIFWNFALEWLSCRFPLVEKWTQPASVVIVRDGEIQHRNMRREMISHEELMSQIRQHGLEDLSKVKVARVEADGRISIIRKTPDGHSGEEDVPHGRGPKF